MPALGLRYTPRARSRAATTIMDLRTRLTASSPLVVLLCAAIPLAGACDGKSGDTAGKPAATKADGKTDAKADAKTDGKSAGKADGKAGRGKGIVDAKS